MTDYHLGRLIQHHRKSKGLTQVQLGELTGYSLSHIGKIEQGLNTPSFTALKKIASVLDFPLDAFIAEMQQEVDVTKKNLLLELNYVASQTEESEFIQAAIQLFNAHNKLKSD